MLYAVLKLIYRAGLFVFFRKLEVHNRALMPDKGPLLVVSNHPNTFMDPIVTASLLRQPVFFLAKGTVFGSKLQNWILRQMHLIPIHRREDNPEQAISNEEAFAASFQALHQQKTLLIFPEGNSFNQRRLRKIKTGTARIALGAEAESPQALGIKILPVGLNYSAPTRFRSDVFINVGQPIQVADYLAAYRQDGPAAVLALTEEIRHRLERLIIHTPTDEEDELARQVEGIYKEQLAATVPARLPEQDFLLTKAIVRSVSYFSQVAPERVAALKRDLSNYRLQLKRLHLQDAVLGKGKQEVLRQSLLSLLFLVLGLPVYLYGLLHNYLPYLIPSKIARAVTQEEEWYAPIMLTAGIFTFPVFYLLKAWLAAELLDLSLTWLLTYFLSLPLSGFFTLGYWNIMQKTQDNWLLLRLFFKRQDVVNKLRQQRQQLIAQLEQARQDYLQETEGSPNNFKDAKA
ncbi:1-acyl-sn-glycerol-3-phosphate acyltransferase [Pontibacter ummariensis]|uniref:1-acyl-sn-glycerol-3-phosphate acyltransferases n=1 Tax=Pontibacter ummariensis TaxID=1610492 RepID=A0A239K834_9BACT|nr:lysophospholipid acyltransferase family protein [Pontibacter ummariensis]PRY06056.1 1-acyl-sn-glycerol-3-phosphate acyltransferase [Pontibacter ummariensis]SNT14636.1 1-acyl-sn-glycerol-3-phosphate acyltransferases [Pontibacter ummariensis]